MRGIFIRFNLGLLLVVLVCMFLTDYIEDAVLTEEEVAHYYNELFKGFFFTIEYYLQHDHDFAPQERIKELQTQFGFPVGLVARSELGLSEDEQELLDRGDMLVRVDDELFYRPLAGSELLVRIGPLNDDMETKRLEYRQNMGVGLFLIMLTSFSSLLWTLPLWKNLRALMRTTERFGRGDFSSRATVARRSALRPMAETFNQMGSRIEELMTAQKSLLHAVSHELRTPIASARFALVMLEGATDRQKIKEYTDMLYGDMEDLEELISELLTYCSLEEQRTSLDAEPVAPKEWLSGLVDKLEPFTGEKIISLDLAMAPASVTINLRHMSRALENLILNAIRYAETRIDIGLSTTDTGWRLSIHDDGPGIPVSDRERIFQPFVRLDDSRNRASGGAGLGLAIVNQIVRKHQGRIWVTDGHYCGACFIMEIPVSNLE